jgi:tRNA-dihydrouridine synthase
MFYKGEADWAAIAGTVDAVDLPVIANGDIDGLPAARSCLAQSGAHAVMVGRAAMGRPWLVAEIEAGLSGTAFTAPALDEQLDSLCEQIADSVSLYGTRLGVRIVRKHVAAAVDAVDLPLDNTARRDLRGRLCRIEDAGELRAALASVYRRKRERVAA